MKCLLDNIIFSLQKSGGASVVWYELISRLLSDHDCDLHFIEYCNANQNIFRRRLNIPCGLLTVSNDSLLKVARYINVRSKYKERHIFHSSHYRIDTNPSAFNITTVHDFVYEYYMHGLQRTVHSCQKWGAIKHSDAIICVSESTRSDMCKFIRNLDESKIFVVYNGVDPAFHVIDHAAFSLNIPFETEEYILYIGSRRVPYKNFDVALRVCAQLKMPLIMVGGEELSSDEKKKIELYLEHNKYVLYRGLSQPLLNELYCRAFALLYPSLYEGFGIPVLEAQRSGCPVIACKRSSIPEVMGESDYCLNDANASAFCEAVQYLKNHYGERDKEKKRGRNNSLLFSWDSAYEKIISIYKQVLNNV